MNHNPKLVSFDRSAAYVRHRALKNMRDNRPVDALELMRRAVEHSPENREYRLDLAEMYCETGCYEQSNRILLDMLTEKDPPAECYYGLALNQFGKNEFESARQALLLYQRFSDEGEYADEVGALAAEIDFIDAMRRCDGRRRARAAKIANRACDALKAEDARKACRLFERSLARQPDQMEMRALYALALRALGDEAAAVEQARRSVADENSGVRSLCVAAQVIFGCGFANEGRALARRAIVLRPEGAELRLLIFTLGEIDMHAEAGDAIRIALREAPLDKMLLHMRAVAMIKSGAELQSAASFWLRILRVDPEDDVANYFYGAALKGEIDAAELQYLYEVPQTEYHSRLTRVLNMLSEGLPACIARWKQDADFRNLLRWTVGTGEENCGCAAVMVIASVDDETAESELRELFYRSDIPFSVKMHAMLFLHLRGADMERLTPAGMDLQDGLLPESETLLKAMPACERQLVRFACEVLEAQYGVRPLSALAVMWRSYRLACAQDNDALTSTQEAAAALAWNYLSQHGLRVPLGNLAIQFDCNRRRLAYYARRMASVLENNGGSQEDENH